MASRLESAYQIILQQTSESARGTFLLVIFFVSTTQISNINATRWHPDWNQHIKLFYNKLLNRREEHFYLSYFLSQQHKFPILMLLDGIQTGISISNYFTTNF